MKVQVSEELYEALWHCQIAAENSDSSLGDSNFRQYNMVMEWLTNDVEFVRDDD